MKEMIIYDRLNCTGSCSRDYARIRCEPKQSFDIRPHTVYVSLRRSAFFGEPKTDFEKYVSRSGSRVSFEVLLSVDRVAERLPMERDVGRAIVRAAKERNVFVAVETTMKRMLAWLSFALIVSPPTYVLS